MKEAMFHQQTQGDEVVCGLCNHHCHIKREKRGLCGVRENHRNGKLYSLAYSWLIAKHVDLIEKNHSFISCPEAGPIPSTPWAVISVASTAKTMTSPNIHIFIMVR